EAAWSRFFFSSGRRHTRSDRDWSSDVCSSDLWHHPAALAGVNVPALVYGDLAGLPRPAVPRARPGVRWCKIWQDGRAARADGVRLVHWIAWALRCEAKSAWSWDDPLPLLCAGD